MKGGAVFGSSGRMDVVILLGAPGSGKGTVAGRLAETVKGFSTVSSGALLRAAIKDQTAAGVEAEGYMSRGELVPDALIAAMIDDYLAVHSAGEGILALDGFPRTVPQARMLDEILKKRGVKLRRAILLDVSEKVLLFRLGGRRICPKCGAGYHVSTIPPKKEGVCDVCGTGLTIRADDTPETIANRLKVYQAQTAPLIDWYAATGVLLSVHGGREATEIAGEIAAAI